MKCTHNTTGDIEPAVRLSYPGGVHTPERMQTSPYPGAPGPTGGRREGPSLPTDVSVDEIEKHMDRVALAIVESPHGQEYLPLFHWLEVQLERKRKCIATMGAIQARVRRLRDRSEAPY